MDEILTKQRMGEDVTILDIVSVLYTALQESCTEAFGNNINSISSKSSKSSHKKVGSLNTICKDLKVEYYKAKNIYRRTKK